MKKLRILGGVALLVTLLTGFGGAGAANASTLPTGVNATANPHAVCDGKSPANITDATTARTATGEVTMQLRFSGSWQCGWAKLINGHPGSQLWVDRTSDGGKTWQPWLGLTQVHSGTSNFTAMYDDTSHDLLRACGNWAHTGPTVCTTWF
jgi:hypothetical protein